jgi:hypothetical protein
MIVEIVPEYYIHITADNGKELVNGETRTKEIYVPLNGDYSMWIEEYELLNDIS